MAQQDQKGSRAKRRGHREGSVYFSESKQLWLGRVMVGYRLNGKPDIRQVQGRTRRQCRERLDAIRAKAAAGTLADAEHTAMTVGDLLDRWLVAADSRIRPSSLRRYRQDVDLHLKPTIGRIRLARATHTDIQAMLDAKAVEEKPRGKGQRPRKLGARSLRTIYVTLGTAMRWAVRRGYVVVNPMVRVDPPVSPRTNRVPLTDVQTVALLDAAGAAGDPLVGLWQLAVRTGARKGELLGLAWADVDLGRGLVRIRRSLVRCAGGVPEWAEPKTDGGKRTLHLDDDAVAELKAHRDRQAFTASKVGEPYRRDLDLVFATPLGLPLNTDSVTKQFRRALGRAGLPTGTRFHDLRHGLASMMFGAGEAVPTVSAQLGHAGPEVTMKIYAHAIPGSTKAASERIGGVLRAARKAAEPEVDPAADEASRASS